MLLQVLDAPLGFHVELVHADLQLHFALLELDDTTGHRWVRRCRTECRTVFGILLAVAVRNVVLRVSAVQELLRRSFVLSHAARPVDDGTHERHHRLQREAFELLLLLRLDQVRMFQGSVFALRDLRQAINHALKDVFLINVAIEVEEELQGGGSVCAELVKDLQHSMLVMIRRVAALQDPEEHLLDADTDLRTQVLLEVEE
mmetsp:Transcript_99383/g.285498  ORF Transcript_99383/g.285498 Transcript_99383/m.285498 type:complete len:202 (-) Transcript_99383:111-716(-)